MLLLSQGALIHKKDRAGEPPLVCAVMSGNTEVIRLLVQVAEIIKIVFGSNPPHDFSSVELTCTPKHLRWKFFLSC